MSTAFTGSALSPKLTDALLEARNADGGFGYLAGQPSATEPTALAAMALSLLQGDSAQEATGRARQWLETTQLASGAWPARPPDTSESWTGALALLALADSDRYAEARRRGLKQLVDIGGRQIKVSQSVFAIDGTLRGWPWSPETFSWVEPTAYALIALKRLRAEAGPEAGKRITEGEALLFDRAVERGGWNYGNRKVYGQPYPPYAETTAVALLALQDHPGRPEIARSLDTLRQAVSGGPASGLQVSWAMLCLATFGLPTDGLDERLATTYKRTAFFGRVPTLAVALLASAGPAGLEPFRLGARS
ncbi:MAG: hypothetical protein ACE5H5_05010 [Nitrospinota bacterium]